jgi:bacterioferritin (cytochrome b1)
MWIYLVPVLYACGYLIAPKTEVLPNQSIKELSGRDLQTMLEDLIKKISKRVSEPELNKVVNIKDNILMLLPRLNEMNAGDYDLHVVKQTVTDYLPQMLTTYLELPPAFARMHKMRNGKTSQEILIEQLTILNDQMEQILVSVNSKDADALIAQGEFLKSKFANDENWL